MYKLTNLSSQYVPISDKTKHKQPDKKQHELFLCLPEINIHKDNRPLSIKVEESLNSAQRVIDSGFSKEDKSVVTKYIFEFSKVLEQMVIDNIDIQNSIDFMHLFSSINDFKVADREKEKLFNSALVRIKASDGVKKDDNLKKLLDFIDTIDMEAVCSESLTKALLQKGKEMGYESYALVRSKNGNTIQITFATSSVCDEQMKRNIGLRSSVELLKHNEKIIPDALKEILESEGSYVGETNDNLYYYMQRPDNSQVRYEFKKDNGSTDGSGFYFVAKFQNGLEVNGVGGYIPIEEHPSSHLSESLTWEWISKNLIKNDF